MDLGLNLTAGEVTVEELVTAQEDFAQSAEPSERAAIEDVVTEMLQYLSGSTSAIEAYVDLPPASDAIWQILDPASTKRSLLHVRLTASFTDPAGKVTVELSGPGLDATTEFNAPPGANGERQHFSFSVERSVERDGHSGPPYVDRLRIAGDNVRLHTVSVRPDAPYFDAQTQKHYELVLHSGGLNYEHATSFAEQSLFEGREGRLATIDDDDHLQRLAQNLEIGTYAWVEGDEVPDSEYSYIDPLTDPAAARLASTRSRPVQGGVPFGYLVEY